MSPNEGAAPSGCDGLPAPPYRLRPMTLADAPVCAEMRMRLIPNTFLNTLGIRFMREVYYAGLCRSSHARACVAIHGERPVAFLCIALDCAMLQRDLRSIARSRILTTLAGRCILHPTVAVNIVRFMAHGRPPIHREAAAEVLGIAVEPEHRGRGLARRLLLHGLDELDRLRGCACRVQAWPEPNGTQAFYERFGFRDPVPFTLMGRQYVMLMRPPRLAARERMATP